MPKLIRKPAKIKATRDNIKRKLIRKTTKRKSIKK